jgi:hypothetical protein
MMKFLSTICFLIFFLGNTGTAQNVIGVVDYMKADNPAAYMEMEKQWQKIHEERLKAGIIIGWAVYQVMFKTIEDPYNFVTISWYDSFSKLDQPLSEEILKKAYPEKSKDAWQNFMAKTDNSRTLISSGVFHQRLSSTSGLDHRGTYYVLNEIKVNPGKSKEYLKITEEIYKPVYDLDFKSNGRTSWSLWAKWPGNMKDFQYASAEGFASLDQIEHTNFAENFKKIHPTKNMEEVSQRMEELRTLVNTEMWKLIYKVLK